MQLSVPTSKFPGEFINLPIHLRVPNDVSMLDKAFPLKASVAWPHSPSAENTEQKEMKMEAKKITPEQQIEIIARIHKYFNNGIRAGTSVTPRKWLEKKGLSIDATGACFNSGQMHHRKSQELKDELVSVGFMKKSDVATNAGQIPYTVFGIFSIVFPLRNIKNEVINFYAIRIKSENASYLNQEKGIYPGYPHELTKKLFIVNSILDAATLLESKVLDNREAVIALHDGKIMPEHQEAIQRLSTLQEIIYIDAPIYQPAKEKRVWDRRKKK
jgi:hypothetical protein